MSDETTERTTAVVIERDAPSEGFAAQLGRAARDNPAAAALIAMGATWLFAGGGNVSIFGGFMDRERRPVGRGRRVRPALPMEAELGASVGDGARRGVADLEGRAQAARVRASRAGREAAGLASDLGDELGDAARAGAHRVGSAARAAGDAAAQAGSAVARRSRLAGRSLARETEGVTEGVGRTVRELLEAQPLAVGALGLAAGAGLAMALPRTRAEAELMGERSDALKARARAAAAGGIDEARARADKALGRVVRDAEARGFSQDAIAGAIHEFTGKLEKVVLAADDAAREEISGKADRT